MARYLKNTVPVREKAGTGLTRRTVVAVQSARSGLGEISRVPLGVSGLLRPRYIILVTPLKTSEVTRKAGATQKCPHD